LLHFLSDHESKLAPFFVRLCALVEEALAAGPASGAHNSTPPGARFSARGPPGEMRRMMLPAAGTAGREEVQVAGIAWRYSVICRHRCPFQFRIIIDTLGLFFHKLKEFLPAHSCLL